MNTVLLLAGLAMADVVGPEPESCPPGSFPTASHFGNYCAPTTCDTSEACPEGECRAVGLCITEFSETNTWWTEEEETYTWSEAYRTCRSDSDCEGEARCIVEDRCVTGGCGCGVVGAGPGLALGLLGLLGLVGFVRRR